MRGVRRHLNSVRIFRAERRVWVAVIVALISMSVVLGAVGLSVAPELRSSALLVLPSLPLGVLFLILVRLAGLRLQLSSDGFEFHDMFGRDFSLHYSEVAALTTKSIWRGRGVYFKSTFHCRDGRRFNANLFPFGREAYRLLQGAIGDA